MKKWILLAAAALLAAGCEHDEDESWPGDSVVPVRLTGIEAVDVDNAGEFPLTVISGLPVPKEAYLLGIRWISDQITDDDDVVGGWIQPYYTLGDPYTKRIWCLTPFNAGTPAGENVSSFFAEIDRRYLPEGVDEGFVLLETPDPGTHTFRVEYYKQADYYGEIGEVPDFTAKTTVELR